MSLVKGCDLGTAISVRCSNSKLSRWTLLWNCNNSVFTGMECLNQGQQVKHSYLFEFSDLSWYLWTIDHKNEFMIKGTCNFALDKILVYCYVNQCTGRRKKYSIALHLTFSTIHSNLMETNAACQIKREIKLWIDYILVMLNCINKYISHKMKNP